MTKAEYVALQLKNRITSGEWESGTRLPSEAELCESYGVSRLTVRNAVGMLAAQGLIDTFKGKGSFVRSVLPESTAAFLDPSISRMDMFEFRRILETESAALAAQRSDHGTIQRLRDVTLRMEQAQTCAEIAACDEEFHLILARATQNEVIIRIFDLLKGAFRVMFQQNVSVLGAGGCAAHMKIIAAIEGRNPGQARLYMSEHLNTTMEKTSMFNFDQDSGPFSMS